MAGAQGAGRRTPGAARSVSRARRTRTRHVRSGLSCFAIAGLVASGAANDYTDGANWLCRPGRQDACAVDLAATVVSADGKVAREGWKADPSAPVDCFY